MNPWVLICHRGRLEREEEGARTEFGNIPQFRGKQRTKSQKKAINKAGGNSRMGGALVAKRRKCYEKEGLLNRVKCN